jgi:hypothetical protein
MYMVNVKTMRAYVNFMAVNYLSITCLSTGRMNVYRGCYWDVRNMKKQENGKHIFWGYIIYVLYKILYGSFSNEG